jgi:hypothetical protein
MIVTRAEPATGAIMKAAPIKTKKVLTFLAAPSLDVML